jgi:spore coat protein U-like protein
VTWSRGAARIALAVALWLAANQSEAACTISTTSVSFGSYNVYNVTNVDTTGSVTYTCGLLTLNPISIDLSNGSSASFNPRTLKNGSDTLNYNLYMDAARSSIWGNGTGGTSHYTATLSPLSTYNVTLTVYGRVPPLQDAAAGSYTDTVVVTINF